MRWSHVQENWTAFYEAIQEKWEDADEAMLDEIDGDQRAFAELGAQLPAGLVLHCAPTIRQGRGMGSSAAAIAAMMDSWELLPGAQAEAKHAKYARFLQALQAQGGDPLDVFNHP